MAKVFRTEDADDDIAMIWAHIASENLKAANRWYSQLDDVSKLLESFPRLTGVDRRLGKPYRSTTIGSYTVIYRLTENEDIILLRVCHSSRKIEDLSLPLEE